MKIRLLGAEFHVDVRTDRQTDRQTDMTKLVVTFRNFSRAPKTYNVLLCAFYYSVTQVDNMDKG